MMLRRLRISRWVLGLALGAIAGGPALVAGILAVLLVVFLLVWAARESERPGGLGGLLVGFGVGMSGLFALADARCAEFSATADGITQGCISPDGTRFFIVAFVVVAAGMLVTLVAARRSQTSS
jgi:hypothetical protein